MDILVFLIEYPVEVAVHLIFHIRPLAGQGVVLADVALVHDERCHCHHYVGRSAAIGGDVDNEILDLRIVIRLLQSIQEYHHIVILGVIDCRLRACASVICLPCLLIAAIERIEHADSGVAFLVICHSLPIGLGTLPGDSRA